MHPRFALRKFLAILFLTLSSSAPARVDSDAKAIERCLKAWGDAQPFGWKAGADLPPFRTMVTKVNVLGIGNSNDDTGTTKVPELVLVKPTVAVLTKFELKLLNPKGWYCLQANVTVLADSVIELACDASIADSIQGAVVLGTTSKGAGSGVTVLGKSTVKRVGCTTEI